MESIFGVRKAAPNAQQRHVQTRKLVAWCVVNGRPWASINDVGLKLVMSGYYIGSSPSWGTHDNVLSKNYSEVAGKVVGAFKALHSEYWKAG